MEKFSQIIDYVGEKDDATASTRLIINLSDKNTGYRSPQPPKSLVNGGVSSPMGICQVYQKSSLKDLMSNSGGKSHPSDQKMQIHHQLLESISSGMPPCTEEESEYLDETVPLKNDIMA